MEPTDRQTGPVDPADDARFDALLAQARWPDPSEASARRLAAMWADISPRRPEARMWRLRPLAVAAAAVLIVATTVALTISRKTVDKSAPSPLVDAAVTAKPPPAPVAAPPEMRVLPVLLYEPGSRAPTMRERLAMYADRRPPAAPERRGEIPTTGVRTRPASVVASPPVDAGALLREGTIESTRRYLELVARQSTRAAALNAVTDSADPPIAMLFDELSSPRVAIRYAAARVLGRMNGPATTAELISRVELDVQRREALAALLCSKDGQAQTFIANAGASRELGAIVRSARVQLVNF